MKPKTLFMILSFLVPALLEGCGQVQVRASPTPTFLPTSTSVPIPTSTNTSTPTATNTSTPTATNTSTPTATHAPSLTPSPQVLENIFPEGFKGAGVASHDYCSQGETGCLHFDVGLPINFTPEIDPVLAPASGNIIEHYVPGGPDWGECITIQPDVPLLGIDELVKNYGYDPSQVRYVYYHLCHIIPWKINGYVEIGEAVGTPKNLMLSVTEWKQWANFVAFVIRIGMQNREIQVSPCELPNKFDWCKICYPGAAERNTCP